MAPHQIADQLRQVAKTCQRRTSESKDEDTAKELEGLATDLAAKAKKLEDLYTIIEAT